jgi:hypothetical protein
MCFSPILAESSQCLPGVLRPGRFFSRCPWVNVAHDSSVVYITYYWLEMRTRRRGSGGFWESVDRQAMLELRQFEHGVRLSHRIYDNVRLRSKLGVAKLYTFRARHWSHYSCQILFHAAQQGYVLHVEPALARVLDRIPQVP